MIKLQAFLKEQGEVQAGFTGYLELLWMHKLLASIATRLLEAVENHGVSHPFSEQAIADCERLIETSKP